MINTIKKNKPRKVKERGATYFRWRSKGHTSEHHSHRNLCKRCPLETPSPGKTSLDQVTFEPEK